MKTTRLVEGHDDLIRQLEREALDYPDFAPVHQHLADLYEEDLRSDDALRARQAFEALSRRK